MIKYENLKSVVSSLGSNQINRTIEDFQAERKLLIDLVEQSAEALRILEEYQIEMDQFLERFWSFYKKLLKYKDSPDNIGAKSLSQEFDLIFDVNSVKYRTLSGQIEKTKNKKTELLAVLNHPEIPLHNNASELGARAHVRKRDVSLQTRTTNGTKAKDTMMTVVETAKKLGINVFNYIHDRINDTLDRTLADEMKIRAGIA